MHSNWLQQVVHTPSNEIQQQADSGSLNGSNSQITNDQIYSLQWGFDFQPMAASAGWHFISD